MSLKTNVFLPKCAFDLSHKLIFETKFVLGFHFIINCIDRHITNYILWGNYGFERNQRRWNLHLFFNKNFAKLTSKRHNIQIWIPQKKLIQGGYGFFSRWSNRESVAKTTPEMPPRRFGTKILYSSGLIWYVYQKNIVSPVISPSPDVDPFNSMANLALIYIYTWYDFSLIVIWHIFLNIKNIYSWKTFYIISKQSDYLQEGTWCIFR